MNRGSFQSQPLIGKDKVLETLSKDRWLSLQQFQKSFPGKDGGASSRRRRSSNHQEGFQVLKSTPRLDTIFS